MKFKKVAIAFVVILIICIFGVGAVLILLSEHDLQAARQENISFDFDSHTIAGTLALPTGEGPFPVAIFIHGDGAQDRFSNGAYNIMINSLLEKGIATFSWDKQGVGESEGNWLHQSMAMRADEAIQAMQTLQTHDDVVPDRIGFIGFSQGGWVLPEIAMQTEEAAFYIVVGGAVNWMDQGKYLTSKRLEGEGYTQAQIEAVLAFSKAGNALILNEASYEDYLAFYEENEAPVGAFAAPMNRDRYRFVLLNATTDARAGLAQINAPFLGIWGEDDLNVDAEESVAIYEEIFASAEHPDYQIVMFPKATHGLLKAEPYNNQNASNWDTSTLITYLLEGEAAYAPGYLELLGEWTAARVVDSGS